MGNLYREATTIITQTDQKVAVLLTIVGSKAYGLLQNLLTPIKSADKDITEIVQVMRNHLRNQFHWRK